MTVNEKVLAHLGANHDRILGQLIELASIPSVSTDPAHATDMRAAANWFPPTQRGRAIGVIGTGYQLCGALTFVIAGWAAEHFGWRGALYVPALLLAASAVHMWFLLEDAPEREPPGSIEITGYARDRYLAA